MILLAYFLVGLVAASVNYHLDRGGVFRDIDSFTILFFWPVYLAAGMLMFLIALPSIMIETRKNPK